MSGSFMPVGEDYYGIKFGTLSKELKSIEAAFTSQQYRMICVNDSIDVTEENFYMVKTNLDQILNHCFPEKSTFEL